MVKTIDPLNAQVNLTYDGNGNLLAVQDGLRSLHLIAALRTWMRQPFPSQQVCANSDAPATLFSMGCGGLAAVFTVHAHAYFLQTSSITRRRRSVFLLPPDRARSVRVSGAMARPAGLSGGLLLYLHSWSPSQADHRPRPSAFGAASGALNSCANNRN